MKLSKLALVLGLGLVSSSAMALLNIDLTNTSDPDVVNFSKGFSGYEWYYSSNFDDTAKGVTLVGLKTSKDNVRLDKLYDVSISNDKSGKQRLYIGVPDGNCTEKSSKPDTRIVNIESVNVKMTHFCEGKDFANLTPSTEKGEQFMVENFKNRNTVKIRLDSMPLIFDATGFTNAWNKHGGDAI